MASCPHCFHTLGKEYGDFGGDELEVFHHSEILAKLQEEGKLPQVEGNGRSMTFHDPCSLGRIGGVFDEPRDIIGGVDVETEKHGGHLVALVLQAHEVHTIIVAGDRRGHLSPIFVAAE